MINTLALQNLLATDASLQPLTDAAAATNINARTTTAYQPFWLTARTLYDQLGAMYHDGFTRAAAVLNNFQSMATSRPASDFYQQITAPGSAGLNLGTADAQSFLNALIDPAGTYAPGPPPVTSIAAGKLLTGTEGQLLASLCSTKNYAVGATVQTSDVTSARAVNAQQANVAALAARHQTASGAVLAQINAYANGPTNGTAPTGTQLAQTYTQAMGA